MHCGWFTRDYQYYPVGKYNGASNVADSNFDTGLEGFSNRSNWVRLRTLVLLRWMAIAGQVSALFVARFHLGITLDLGLCMALVALSVVTNLTSGIMFPHTRRLTQLEALALLVFDVVQLSALLYLTGGLDNPFALLLLAPTTIAAAALEARSTALVAVLTIIFTSLLAVYNVPLILPDGTRIAVPRLYAFGFWLALVIGVVFLGLYAFRISRELHAMGNALLATQMVLAREQKMSALSGVVAAAAHELGTPLATIKLTSSELADELADRPELREDARLIREQADRCRDILRSMGRAGKEDLHMRAAPFAAVLDEAAEPHLNRNALVHVNLPDASAGPQPLVRRQPEIIHGLRNLIQNAVDFSRTSVWIDLSWTPSTIQMRIVDDGPGFPPGLIGRIGDPFMRHRSLRTEQGANRDHYEGMGLGLFIAKSLLERTGATLRFENADDPLSLSDGAPARCGAQVTVTWRREAIEASAADSVGENRPYG